MADLLLVDNDARIVELTSWFLDRAGHRVATALSYAEARGLLESGKPDLLLADLELGEERGREELPKLAEAGLLPPTLVVSGFLDAELTDELLRIPGVVGTLAKPIDLAELEARVSEAVASNAESSEVPKAEEEEASRDALIAELELEPQPAPASYTPTPPSMPRMRSEPDEDGWVEILPDLPGPAGTSDQSPRSEDRP